MNGETLYDKWLSGVQLTYNELLSLSEWMSKQLQDAYNRNDAAYMTIVDNQRRKVAMDIRDFR
jgi:hypothetical protein